MPHARARVARDSGELGPVPRGESRLDERHLYGWRIHGGHLGSMSLVEWGVACWSGGILVVKGVV